MSEPMTPTSTASGVASFGKGRPGSDEGGRGESRSGDGGRERWAEGVLMPGLHLPALGRLRPAPSGDLGEVVMDGRLVV